MFLDLYKLSVSLISKDRATLLHFHLKQSRSALKKTLDQYFGYGLPSIKLPIISEYGHREANKAQDYLMKAKLAVKAWQGISLHWPSRTGFRA